MLKICSGFPGQHLVGGSVWKAERVEGHEWRQIVGAEPIYIYIYIYIRIGFGRLMLHGLRSSAAFGERG